MKAYLLPLQWVLLWGDTDRVRLLRMSPHASPEVLDKVSLASSLCLCRQNIQRAKYL